MASRAVTRTRARYLRSDPQYRGTVVRTALLALALPALFACSGGGDGDGSGAPAGSSASGGSHASGAAAPEPEQLTEAQLKDTLPSSSDMSTIFIPTDESDSGKDRGTFLCGTDVGRFDRRNAAAKVGYVAQVGISATRYSFAINQFDSPAIAAEQVQALGTAIDACRRFTSNGDTYTVAPMPATPSDGDTVAVQVTTRSAGFAVTVDVLVVRSGSSLVESLSATLGLAAGSTVDDVVHHSQETVDRYEAAAGIA